MNVVALFIVILDLFFINKASAQGKYEENIREHCITDYASTCRKFDIDSKDGSICFRQKARELYKNNLLSDNCRSAIETYVKRSRS